MVSAELMDDGLVQLRARLLQQALAETSALSAALSLAREAWTFVRGEEPKAPPPPVVPAIPELVDPARFMIKLPKDSDVFVAPAAAPAPAEEPAAPATPAAAGTPRLWTDSDKVMVVQMLRDGASVAAIAEATGRSKSAINSYIYVAGGRDALLGETPAPPVPPASAPPSSAEVSFSLDEDMLLARALDDGATLEQAAEYMGRPIDAIRLRLAQGGGQMAFLDYQLKPALKPAPSTAPKGVADRPSTFNVYTGRKTAAPITPGRDVSAADRAAIDARVAAGQVTPVPPNYHSGHTPQVLKDLE